MHLTASRGNSAVYAALAAVVVCVAVGVAALAIRSGGGSPQAGAVPAIAANMGENARTIALPGPPASLAVGAGSLWIPTYGQVLRLDPATGRVIARISLPAVGENATVVTSPTGIWVAPGSDHTVVRIDPRFNAVRKTIDVGFYPLALRIAAHRVLVISGTLTGTPIDPATYRVGAAVPVAPYTDPHVARAVTRVKGYDGVRARGRIWVVTWGPNRHHPDPGTLSMLDARSGRLVQTRKVGGTPTGVAVGFGAVWVSNFADNTLTRIPLRGGP